MSMKIKNPKIREIFAQDDLPLGKLIHLYGVAGSGKTTFCLQNAYLMANKGRGHKTLYIDTMGLHSINRLKQISSTSFDEVSSLILFSNPSSFNEQNKLINNLSNFINEDIKLIIIDNIVSYYRAEMAKKPKGIKIGKMLNQQMAQLKDIASKNGIMIIIVNQVRADLNNPENATTPLNKKVFDHWSDLEIEFLIHPEEKTVRLSILRRPSDKTKIGSKCTFKISQEGLI